MTLNKVMVIGNLTRDPESRTTPNGTVVCTFGVATNRAWSDQQGQRQEEAEFHNIVTFGKLAEICGQYLGKGRKVYIEGRMKTREWQSQDGTKRNRTEIVAENMIMLDRTGKEPSGAAKAYVPQPIASAAAKPDESSVGAPVVEEVKVEEIPF
ncbi:MAG: single-stranded DNA-binding protein [Candidatus Uhrbacteria bacterium]